MQQTFIEQAESQVKQNQEQVRDLTERLAAARAELERWIQIRDLLVKEPKKKAKYVLAKVESKPESKVESKPESNNARSDGQRRRWEASRQQSNALQ